MRTVIDMILIARPVNCLIAALSVAVAGLLLMQWPPLSLLVPAAAGAAFVCGFGNTINDCADRDIDAINRPGRLIPSGRVSLRQAYASAFIQVVAGMALSQSAGILPFCVSVATAAMLAVYAFAIKRVPVLSNVWVALMAAMVFPYTMAISGDFGWSQAGIAWLGAVLVFLFHTGREIVKDIEDMSGDSAGGIRTLPMLAGVKSAKTGAVAALTLHAALLITALASRYQSAFGVAALCLYLFGLTIVLRRLSAATETPDFARVQRQLKILMPFGLTMLLIMRFTV